MGLRPAERREMEMWDAQEALLDAMVEGSDEQLELTARYECLKEEHKQLLAVEGWPLTIRGAAGSLFHMLHKAGSMLLGRLPGKLPATLASGILKRLRPQARPAEALLHPRETCLQWQVVEAGCK